MVVDARKQIQMVKSFLREQEEDIKNKVWTGNVVYQTTQTELVRLKLIWCAKGEAGCSDWTIEAA